MRWYVLQTKTGEEEKLVEMIHRIIPKHLYGECFVVYHEQLWRRQQKNFVHVKRAFPGYVFITSNDPEALFFCLKKLPAMAKLMADNESCFLSLLPEETLFLKQITDEHHVIGLSYLETDGNGMIHQVSGPLASCLSQIVRYRFGKRHVLAKINLLGQEKEILLGIVLNEDIRQEVQDKKVRLPIKIPEQYRAIQAVNEQWATEKSEKIRKKNLSNNIPNRGISTGDTVWIIDGIFQGMSAMVYQVNTKTVKIGIRLFGRNMEIELPLEIVKKNKINQGQMNVKS